MELGDDAADSSSDTLAASQFVSCFMSEFCCAGRSVSQEA
jgi:hypothetical protein